MIDIYAGIVKALCRANNHKIRAIQVRTEFEEFDLSSTRKSSDLITNVFLRQPALFILA